MSGHVIWDNDTPPAPRHLKPGEQMILRCTHCGELHVVVFPVALDMLSGVMRLFHRLHRACKPRPAPQPLTLPPLPTDEGAP